MARAVSPTGCVLPALPGAVGSPSERVALRIYLPAATSSKRNVPSSFAVTASTARGWAFWNGAGHRITLARAAPVPSGIVTLPHTAPAGTTVLGRFSDAASPVKRSFPEWSGVKAHEVAGKRWTLVGTAIPSQELVFALRNRDTQRDLQRLPRLELPHFRPRQIPVPALAAHRSASAECRTCWAPRSPGGRPRSCASPPGTPAHPPASNTSCPLCLVNNVGPKLRVSTRRRSPLKLRNSKTSSFGPASANDGTTRRLNPSTRAGGAMCAGVVSCALPAPEAW